MLHVTARQGAGISPCSRMTLHSAAGGLALPIGAIRAVPLRLKELSYYK